MSEETKSDKERDSFDDTSERWEKNAADHQRLELRLVTLEAKMDGLRGEMGSLRGEMDSLRGEMDSLRGEVHGLRDDQREMRTEQREMRTEQAKMGIDFKEELASLSATVISLIKDGEDRRDKQRKDDRWFTFSIIGIILTVLALILTAPALSKLLQIS